MIMNQTQPVLLSQSHLKGKHTLSAQIALGIRQSQDRTGYLTQHRKPPRFKL